MFKNIYTCTRNSHSFEDKKNPFILTLNSCTVIQITQQKTINNFSSKINYAQSSQVFTELTSK